MVHGEVLADIGLAICASSPRRRSACQLQTLGFLRLQDLESARAIDRPRFPCPNLLPKVAWYRILSSGRPIEPYIAFLTRYFETEVFKSRDKGPRSCIYFPCLPLVTATSERHSNNLLVLTDNIPARGASLENPQFAATFVPGGFDDYYMPEVIAPAPQRSVAPAYLLTPGETLLLT